MHKNIPNKKADNICTIVIWDAANTRLENMHAGQKGIAFLKQENSSIRITASSANGAAANVNKAAKPELNIESE